MPYAYYSQITIDKDQVGETDANFAVLINGVYDGTGGEPDLRTAANGGNVQNTASGGASGSLTVPADLVFSPNPDGSSPYDFEFEYYNPATGEIIAHVQSGVDTAADPVFYIAYGDSDVTTSQENVSGTWDAGFKGVWHLGEASGTRYDSTSIGNNLTDNNTVTQGSGQVGNAAQFDDANSEHLSRADTATLDGGDNSYTIEGWFSQDDFSANHMIVTKLKSGSYDYQIFTNSAAALYVQLFSTTTKVAEVIIPSLDISTWYYFAAQHDPTANKARLLLNNGSWQEDTESATPATSSAEFQLGGRELTPSQFVDGKIDEVRFSQGVVRNSGYFTTCYNSQSSPSTFYSMGAEQSAAKPYAFIM